MYFIVGGHLNVDQIPVSTLVVPVLDTAGLKAKAMNDQRARRVFKIIITMVSNLYS